jgi:hypothetical protein
MNLTMKRSCSWVGSYRIGDKLKTGGALAGTIVVVTGGNSLTVTCVGDCTGIWLASGGNSFTGASVVVTASAVVAVG